MARLYIFAEGPTEQVFATNLLAPHLLNTGVYLQAAILIAHARKRGIVHRGGGRNYVAMKNDILRFTAQEHSSDVFFTTMIDLYAIHPHFPGLEESRKISHLPLKRVEFLEQAFAHDIGDERFIPHIQLHEYEAYLFCDLDCFLDFYPRASKDIDALKVVAKSYETPEFINDGQHTAPSKRITKCLPGYEGVKPTVGVQVAQRIGLQKIRDGCPHFHSWLSRLEQLGED
jgi:hypothetical protein